MNLLAPLFLAGLLAIAAPIVAHLIRRATRERFAFSAIQFLEESAPRLDRRSRIEHPWLLALRALAVALLAFGFARPYLRSNPLGSAAPAPPRHVVALLDASASMQRPGLWPAARARIQALADSLEPQDRFVLLAAGAAPRTLVTPVQWDAASPAERRLLVSAALAAQPAGWGPARLDAAVEAGLSEWESMAERDAQPGTRELVIVSDFASGTPLGGLADLDWPAGAKVSLAPVESERPGNASLHWLGWRTDAQGRAAIRLRVTRSFEVAEALRWRWIDAVRDQPLDGLPPLDLLPGGQSVLTLPWPEGLDAVRLELEGDGAAFDNQLWVARPTARHLRLVYLGDHDAADPAHAAFYLSRAAAGIDEPAIESGRVLGKRGAEPTLIVMDGALDASTSRAVRDALEAGAFALWLNAPATEGAENARSRDALLATLTGEAGWRTEASERSDAMFGQVDFQHPLFAPFADPRFSDFTRIRFWRPQPIQPPADSRAQVVARFDDESPAVIEHPVGAGRLILWSGGWAPSEGQWVLSSKFVPWLLALIERAAGGARLDSLAEVGDASRLLRERGTGAQWRRLDGIAPAAAESDGAPPSAPGVYELIEDGAHRLVALNVPAAESQLDVVPLDTWEQLGVPLEAMSPNDLVAAEVAARQVAHKLEQQQQLWRALLWFTLAVLGLESAMSIWLSRRASVAPAPARL